MNARHWKLRAGNLAAAVAIVATEICFAAEPALHVKSPSGRTLDLSIDELKQLPRQSVKVEESPGVFVEYAGVALHEVLKAAGTPTEKGMRGAALKQYVLAEAADGYRVVFAMVETEPGFSDQVILVCYLRDSKPLSTETGPLRLVAPADKRHARWVRQVKRIEVRQVD